MLTEKEIEKLNVEVEKLKLEVKYLNRPYLMHPGNWIAIIGLVISISLNIKQRSEAQEAEKLAAAELANTKLENKMIDYETIDLEKKKDFAKMQLDSINNVCIDIQIAANSLQKLPPTEWEPVLKKINLAGNKIDSLSKEIKNNFETPLFQNAKDSELARQKEKEGYEKLVNKDFEGAYAAFNASENAYNGYRWSYELMRVLKKGKDAAAKDDEKRKELFQTILTKYKNGIPDQYLDKIKKLAN